MFTAAGAGAALLALAAKFLPIALAAIADYVLKSHAAAQTRADDIALGQATTTAAVNKETADADHRAAEVAVNAPPVGSMLDAMSRGEF